MNEYDLVHGPTILVRQSWKVFKNALLENLDHFDEYSTFAALDELRHWRLPEDLHQEKTDLINKLLDHLRIGEGK